MIWDGVTVDGGCARSRTFDPPPGGGGLGRQAFDDFKEPKTQKTPETNLMAHTASTGRGDRQLEQYRNEVNECGADQRARIAISRASVPRKRPSSAPASCAAWTNFTLAGLTATLFWKTSKWRCGPVDRPVEPT